MNAESYLNEIAQWFAALQLDAVMIGNAAAAINGAPVTTLDIDFMLENTDENYRKLAFLAQQMNCLFMEMKLTDDKYIYRLKRRDDPLMMDFLFSASGLKDFKTVKQNSTTVFFGENPLAVASLEDIIASKRAAGRPKDIAITPILEMTLDEQRKH